EEIQLFGRHDCGTGRLEVASRTHRNERAGDLDRNRHDLLLRVAGTQPRSWRRASPGDLRLDQYAGSAAISMSSRSKSSPSSDGEPAAVLGGSSPIASGA